MLDKDTFIDLRQIEKGVQSSLGMRNEASVKVLRTLQRHQPLDEGIVAQNGPR